MKQKWLEMAARFNALASRERILIAATILIGGGFLGYAVLVESQLMKEAVNLKRTAQAKSDLAGVEAQLAAVQSQLKDPDATNRAALQQVRKNMAAIDLRLRGIQDSLVPPEKMQVFLAGLLTKNRNLEVLALRTLPVTMLIEHADEKKTDGKELKEFKDGKKDRKPAAITGSNIYKHGVEIRIAGSYNDLLAYLAEVELMPQRIIWSRVELSTEKYPRSVLTLTVYTLSLDKKWLVV